MKLEMIFKMEAKTLLDSVCVTQHTFLELNLVTHDEISCNCLIKLVGVVHLRLRADIRAALPIF